MYTTEQRLVIYIKRMRLDKPNRRPFVSDQRFYAIGLLYYKFGWTESKIARLLDKNRTSIWYAKVKPYEFLSMNDEKFKFHCKKIMNIFPYTFPKPLHYNQPNHRRVYHNLNKERENKLLEFKSLYPRLQDLNETMNLLIDTFL